MKSRYFCIGIFFLYAAVVLFFSVRHVPWEDEVQAWLVARDTASFGAMLDVMGYEGTPALWHMLLFPLSRVGFPIKSMAVLNALILIAAAGVFLRFAPLTRVQKFLFVFGYFFFFEYGVVARSYGLSVLLLFCIAALYPRRLVQPVVYTTGIALLAQTNVHSFIFAVVLGVFFCIELLIATFPKSLGKQNFLAARLRGPTRSRLKIPSFLNFSFLHTAISLRALLAAPSILLFSYGLALWQVWPPADLALFMKEWDFRPLMHGIRVVIALCDGFIPIPGLVSHLWNAPILCQEFLTQPYALPPYFFAALGIFFFILSCWILKRSRDAVLLYLGMSFGLFALFSLRHPGSVRHHGFLFLAFIFCLWVADGRGVLILQRRVRSGVITLVLLVQLCAGVIMGIHAFRIPFSAHPEVISFLESRHAFSPDTCIAIYPTSRNMSLFASLSRGMRPFYSLESEAFRTYTVWNNDFDLYYNFSYAELSNRMEQEFGRGGYDKGYLVFTRFRDQIEEPPQRIGQYVQIGRFFDSLSEQYFVYERQLETP